MAVKNATILDNIWLNGTNDYQQRVPKATQAGVAAVQRAIFGSRDLYNQFVDAFVNRIGMTLIHQRRWENPLALFKVGMLENGDKIQEVANQLIKAKGYELDAQTLLEVNRPESKVFYHEVNRQDKYPLTINEVELRKAFIDDYGLQNYLNSLLEIPFTSDNYDEYLIMVQLIAEFEHNNGGFFKVHVSDVIEDDTGAAARKLLKLIRGYVGRLKFLSAMYNRAGIPNYTPADDLILITTPEIKAAMDVDALAQLFHLEKAEVQTRIVEIEQFPIVGAQALLVDRNWFVCADYVYENTSFYNPETLSTNYWLHHWGVYSVSPFMNAILFTTEAATQPVTGKMELKAIDLEATEIDDRLYSITNALTGSSDKDVVDVAPKSVVYSMVGTLDNEGVNLYKTYIDRDNVLHIDPRIEDGTVIKITGVSTYINPSGTTEELKDEVEITIGGGLDPTDVSLKTLKIGNNALTKVSGEYPNSETYTCTTSDASNTIIATANNSAAKVTITVKQGDEEAVPISSGDSVTWTASSAVISIEVDDGKNYFNVTINVTTAVH